jgi:hypothetical protein
LPGIFIGGQLDGAAEQRFENASSRCGAVPEANDRFALASARKLNGAREANMKAA